MDDPTIRRITGFAGCWGFGGVDVVNLFAYRATDSAVLRSVVDPVGPENDDFLRKCLSRSAVTIAAWGGGGRILGRAEEVARMAGDLYCLGTTKAGDPRHPLYLPRDARPERWGGPHASN